MKSEVKWSRRFSEDALPKLLDKCWILTVWKDYDDFQGANVW